MPMSSHIEGDAGGIRIRQATTRARQQDLLRQVSPNRPKYCHLWRLGPCSYCVVKNTFFLLLLFPLISCIFLNLEVQWCGCEPPFNVRATLHAAIQSMLKCEILMTARYTRDTRAPEPLKYFSGVFVCGDSLVRVYSVFLASSINCARGWVWTAVRLYCSSSSSCCCCFALHTRKQ